MQIVTKKNALLIVLVMVNVLVVFVNVIKAGKVLLLLLLCLFSFSSSSCLFSGDGCDQSQCTKCVNGQCVGVNDCKCNEGFQGQYCDTPLIVCCHYCG